MTKTPLIVIFLLSLIIRLLTALPQHAPHSMDEAYSYINAVTLAKGEGFVEHFIWNYLNPPQTVTHPGNLYWMPLSSIIAWAGLIVGGTSYDSAQWGFILLSALLPPLGYWMAWQISGLRRHAWVVALMMLFSGFYFFMWPTIDNFTPFALAGSLCLFAAWPALEQKRLSWAFLAGVMAGLAHLTRADGPLLLLVIGLIALSGLLLPGKVFSVKLTLPQGLKALALIGAGYLLVMGPWFMRNLALVGAPLPPGGAKTMWLRSYDDLFSYGRDLSWQSYLAWGVGPILQSKGWALGQNLQHILAEPGMIFALPFAIVGWWQLRRHLLFQTTALYLGLLFLVMTLVFTFPGPRGAIFHSAAAALPFMFIAAITGLDATVEAIARRRSTWRAATAKTVFSAGFVGLALLLTLMIYTTRLNLSADPANAHYPALVAALPEPEATVMIGNPPAWLFYGGERAIVIPNEPIETTLLVADRYGATYLILDKNHPAPLRPHFANSTAHPRLQLEATLDGPTYLYRILP
jgi:hypothetical protein